jgi:hypothetical protein
MFQKLQVVYVVGCTWLKERFYQAVLLSKSKSMQIKTGCFEVRERVSCLTAGHCQYLALCSVSDGKIDRLWSRGGMMPTENNWGTPRRTCPSATWCTTNLSQTDRESNADLCTMITATSLLYHSDVFTKPARLNACSAGNCVTSNFEFLYAVSIYYVCSKPVLS